MALWKAIHMSVCTKTIQNYPTLVPLSPAFFDMRVCHLSVVTLFCIGKLHVLTITFGLSCFIFHGFHWVLQCVFYAFAGYCLHFRIVFPD